MKEDISDDLVICESLQLCNFLCQRGREWKNALIKSEIFIPICKCLIFYDLTTKITRICQQILINISIGLPDEKFKIQNELIKLFKDKDSTIDSYITLLQTFLQLKQNNIELKGESLIEPIIQLYQFENTEISHLISELLDVITTPNTIDLIYHNIYKYLYDLEIYYNPINLDILNERYLGVIYYIQLECSRKPELLTQLINDQIITCFIALGFVYHNDEESVRSIIDCLSYLMVRNSDIEKLISDIIGEKGTSLIKVKNYEILRIKINELLQKHNKSGRIFIQQLKNSGWGLKIGMNKDEDLFDIPSSLLSEGMNYNNNYDSENDEENENDDRTTVDTKEDNEETPIKDRNNNNNEKEKRESTTIIEEPLFEDLETTPDYKIRLEQMINKSIPEMGNNNKKIQQQPIPPPPQRKRRVFPRTDVLTDPKSINIGQRVLINKNTNDDVSDNIVRFLSVNKNNNNNNNKKNKGNEMKNQQIKTVIKQQEQRMENSNAMSLPCLNKDNKNSDKVTDNEINHIENDLKEIDLFKGYNIKSVISHTVAQNEHNDIIRKKREEEEKRLEKERINESAKLPKINLKRGNKKRR